MTETGERTVVQSMPLRVSHSGHRIVVPAQVARFDGRFESGKHLNFGFEGLTGPSWSARTLTHLTVSGYSSGFRNFVDDFDVPFAELLAQQLPFLS